MLKICLSLLNPSLEKAVRGSDHGFNPINDGKVLKVPIPPLDEDRRREIAKRIGKMIEEETKEFIAELEKEIAEDDKFMGLEKLQSLLDEHVKKIEEYASTKEKEILER